MKRRTVFSIAVVAASLGLGLLAGRLGATPGGATRPALVYVGTLSGVPDGPQLFAQILAARSEVCGEGDKGVFELTFLYLDAFAADHDRIIEEIAQFGDRFDAVGVGRVRCPRRNNR